MSNLQWPDKDPADILDYDADFSEAIPSGDNIAGVVWTVPSGLTSVLETYDNPTKTATIWLSGGTDGEDYTITCKLTTDSAPVARVIERDIGLNCRNLL